MAGKKHKSTSFFEALPMAMTPIGLRRGVPKEGRSTIGRLGYVPAALKDASSLTKGAWRRLTSRRVRMVALAVISSVMLAGVVTATAVASTTLTRYANDISSPAAMLAKKRTGITILDRNGEVLYRGYGASLLETVPLAQLPQNLKDATLAAEDADFYTHPGFSWRGMARAMYVDIQEGRSVQGGSTITQQLVKNALLTSEKTLERKYREVLLSMELERRYSKDQIFELYLNEVYYGQGAYGVEAASQTYFKKSARDLTLAQAALLAGLPQSPSRLDPSAYPERAKERRDYVLGRMLELGKITPEQAQAAKAEPIVASPRQVPFKAPHFVEHVIMKMREKYGDEKVEQGGMTVYTTLDYKKQQAAESIVREKIGALAANNVTNAGLVALEPATGDIISMVGSVDYNQPSFGALNVTTQSLLQPGSSIKPIVYVTAFKKGWTGAHQVEDKPLRFPGANGTVFEPQNYDRTFRGEVTVRRALQNSLNIPALNAIRFAGVDETAQTAGEMGIASMSSSRQRDISMALGSVAVRPIEMAAAYSAFADNGRRTDPRAILKVEDRRGKIIFEAPKTPQKAQAIDPRLAFMITHILSDNNARAEEFGLNSPLKLSRTAAAKTGTTNEFRDNWTVGYTPDLVTAVWVGNNDRSPMRGVTGVTGAAPIWNSFMEAAHAGLEPREFQAPAGIATARVCSRDGGLANPWDTSYDEVFLADAMPTRRCSSAPPVQPKVEEFQSRVQSRIDRMRERIEARMRERQETAGEPQPTPGRGTGPETPPPPPPPAPEPQPTPQPAPQPQPAP